jgi:outer membrane receptor for ferrienterochelin and colicins
MKKIIYIPIYLLFLLISGTVNSQAVKGFVLDQAGIPLPGASVFWAGTSSGTASDANGAFLISPAEGATELVASFVGYIADTITASPASSAVFRLRSSGAIGEVGIRASRPDMYISDRIPIKTEVITSAELTKAACCDLAGCFDTQASVQAATTNIVTNAKELRMLGLSGTYNQVLIEGMPMVQGLGYTYGLNTVPGSFVERIMVSKGANSVLQGAEGISGQTNVLLKAPGAGEKYFLNLYANAFAEAQLNSYMRYGKGRAQSITGVHTSQPAMPHDGDGDGFLDMPLLSRYALYHRTDIGSAADMGWNTMLYARGAYEDRTGGLTSYDRKKHRGSSSVYGQHISFWQPEAFIKTGYRLDAKNYFALHASGFYHSQDAYYGTLRYTGQQKQAYANLQYERKWGSAHAAKLGASYSFSDIAEEIILGENPGLRTYGGRYSDTESVPGVFAENTFSWKDGMVVLITGLRADFHSRHGAMVSPRGLLKYSFSEKTTIRLSAGTGWRSAKVFSENAALLASARDIQISKMGAETALNYGVNIVREVRLWDRGFQLSADYYRTHFFSHAYVDYSSLADTILVGSQGSGAVSDGAQLEFSGDILPRIYAKAAYNYSYVTRKILGVTSPEPFNARHKWVGALSFKSDGMKHQADINGHVYGAKDMPAAAGQPGFKSPAYFIANVQYTRMWKRIDVYLGCENVFNFRQEKPILGWEAPFGTGFDPVSGVWGPTRGREIYAGLRLRI